MSDKEEYNVELCLFDEKVEVGCDVDPVTAVIIAEEKCLRESENIEE